MTKIYKTYRMKDGWLYIWESSLDGDDVIIVERRYKKLPEGATISNFAEKLINSLQEE